MSLKRAANSQSPEPSDSAPVSDGSALPPEQWAAMQDILNAIYNYRTADNYDPSKAFHKKVNRRLVPGYYDIITEPVALSTIKARLQTKEYNDFRTFVRDFALIFHNAQVFNRPDAGAYQDAALLREQLEYHLQKYVSFKIISTEQATLPYLGDIPTQDDTPQNEDDDDDDDDDDDEEDEEDDDDESGQPAKRGRGRPKGSTKANRESLQSVKDLPTPGKQVNPNYKRERRRPPKIQTPIEARIQAVLKGMRKPKTPHGLPKIHHFERLPDRAIMPEYYDDIKNPMAYDILRRKHKRRKYTSLDEFMADVDVLFENAKSYNQDGSDIFNDAVALQIEAHRIADEERRKPDSEFAMEEGRIPMPEGLVSNGELFRVGDWVLIQNANDLSKPIPSQIYRTYKDSQGQDWVNVCWYYRPEQTVHRYDKHFFENELAKTGQYKDHRADEIVGRCFIMFVTRYFKGRPKDLPPGTPLFVTEARYNEEKNTFNKVKTWISCLPDEVRDKDYEMDLFPEPRKMKKYPSPLAHMLPANAKETDPLPKPVWGAKNAPPKIGAVHKRPRDPLRDSLPPEPSPPPAAARTTGQPPAYTRNAPSTDSGRPSLAHPSNQFPTSRSPAPQGYVAPGMQRTTPSTPTPGIPPRPPLSSVNTSYTQQVKVPHPNQYTKQEMPTSTSHRDPAPIEAYTLPDAVDASIPERIRALFDRDESGHVLFFTAPPLYLLPAAGGTEMRHSVRYRAAKLREARDAGGIAERRAESESRRRKERAESRAGRAEGETQGTARADRGDDEVERTIAGLVEERLSHALSADLVALGAASVT